MKIIFFGTPDYVIPILDSLHKKFRSRRGESPIVGVVTQRPKPAGREQKITYSAVDAWAHKKNIPIFYSPANLLIDKVEADLGVVASYGGLLPEQLIKHFPHGILVVHPSLLPQFRWGSPVPAAIIAGINPTGVTIIKMDAKFDHGPIVTQFTEAIEPDDTYQTLRDRLFLRSANVLVELIEPYLAHKIKPKPQDDTKATFARMIKKQDAFIPPEYLQAAVSGEQLAVSWDISFIKSYSQQLTTNSLERFIRAMSPWPGAWTLISIKCQVSGIKKTSIKKRIKLLKAHVDPDTGHLTLDTVQLEGKKSVTWKQFCEAYPAASFSAE